MHDDSTKTSRETKVPQDASTLAEDLAHRCEEPKPDKNGWLARCPAHQDATPSLSITPDNDKVLLHCFAGCTAKAIVEALGLTMADLFLQPKRRTNGHKRIAKIYDYHDTNGHVVHQTVRYDPKGFTQRRPDPANPGKHIWDLKGIEPMLYRLPDLHAALQAGQTIYLPEGEKDVEALRLLGLAATCNAMGAGKWRQSYSEVLRGGHCVILPDNDAPGREHAQQVARSLDGKAASVKVLALPGLPAKGDVSDWLQAGGTREALEAFVADTPAWEPYTSQEDTPQGGRQRNGTAPGPEGAQTQADEQLPYSDVYNARRLVHEHGNDLHYCYLWGKWLTWTGTHWETDDAGESMRRAKATSVAMVQDARQWLERVAAKLEQAALAFTDVFDDNPAMRAAKKEQKAAQQFFAHAASSLQDRRLKAMLAQAQSEPAIPILPQDLDANHWLLNCTNGTLDLRTGELRPHQRGDLLTKCIPVAYDPAAPCPTWDAFLHRIMAGNQALISFLQRAVGYAITGVIREHVLLILWGSGRNGKSTFLNTFRDLLGPYAMKATSDLLLVSSTDRHPTERADLFGKRFVSAIETEQSHRLAEVFVKEATGGDPIRARRMREDFWEFWPTHKVFLATNHKPVIRGTDNAIWERIRLVPFTVTIPLTERDTTLPDKLHAELPGILAWAVRGCLAWQREGLGEPDEVQQATAGYRAEMDVVGQFLAECCLIGPNYRTKAAELYDAYKRWCDQNGEHAVQRTLGMQLTERGYERKRGTGGYYWWVGLGLIDTHIAPQGESPPESDSQVNQVNDSEPTFGINEKTQNSLEKSLLNRKLGSLGSLGSLDVDKGIDTPSVSPPAVGDWVWLLSADGVQQNSTPYQIQAIVPDPHAVDPTKAPLYALFAEMKTGWPRAQCERTTPPAVASTVSSGVPPGQIPIAPPPPEAPPASTVHDSGGASGLAPMGRPEPCPQCGCRTWAQRLTSMMCQGCGYKDGPTPADIRGEPSP